MLHGFLPQETRELCDDVVTRFPPRAPYSQPAKRTASSQAMLETGLPPEDERKEPRSVSPLSSHHTSRSSTPGISFFDGTPLYLFPFSISPRDPCSTSPPHDMAVKTVQRANGDNQEQSIQAISTLPELQRTEVTQNGALSPRDGPEGTLPISAPPLADLSHLLRLEKYQVRRSCQIQRELYTVAICSAKTARLLHTARSVQRTLAECIKSEDKQSFINLFNALNDALSECCELSDGLREHAGMEDGHCQGYPPSFLDALSVETRDVVLSFLARIRYDREFLAERLTALNQKELVALLPEKGLSKSEESVFGSSPRSSFRTSKYLGFVVDGQTELLSSLELASPLEVLIHAVRGTSGVPLEDDKIATDAWATVCARLISEQKPGSEKLVPAVINHWALSSWPGKDRLEIWLLQTLQEGSTLLEQFQKQTFRVRAQGRTEPTPEDQSRLESFYTKAANSLLRLLADPSGASVIPEGARRLCRLIWSKLRHSPRHQQSFPNFVMTRWLFSSFIIDAITVPEIHGLLSDYFVSENSRQRVLREIATRCQKVVFDTTYSWKHSGAVREDALQLIRAIASRFEGETSKLEEGVVTVGECLERTTDSGFVAVSANDVTTLVNTLYPIQIPSSISDRDLPHSGLQSSASSISGFSIFQAFGTPDSGTSTSVPYETDGACSMDRLSSAETTATPGNSSETTEFAAYEETDGQRLREACVVIEDFLTSRPQRAPDQWSVLMADPTMLGLCTLRETLLESDPATKSPVAAHQVPSTLKACRSVIEELLQDDSLGLISASAGCENQPSKLHTLIARALNQKITRLKENADFVTAHSYFRKLRHLSESSDDENHAENLVSLLRALESDKQQSLLGALSTIESSEDIIRSMRSVLDDLSRHLVVYEGAMGGLRDKMWYVADVRTSAIYDEARAVATALKTMGKRPKPARTRLTPSSRTWNGNRTSNPTFQFKTEAQVLELLSAPPDHGGRNKLSDDHSKAVRTWLQHHAAENFCRGEERLHKLCMEIQKAVDQLTAEGSTLRSSTLFARDRPRLDSIPAKHNNVLWTLHEDRRRFDLLTLRTDVKPNHEAMSTGSQPLSARSSRDYLDSWSPSVTNRSSATLWSPVLTEARSPSSVTSMGSSHTQAGLFSTVNKQVQNVNEQPRNSTEQLRQHTTSLLLSDLGSALFGDGSETDRAFWAGLGGELTEKYLRNLYFMDLTEGSGVAPPSGFDFANAFEELTLRFSVSTNPYAKLKRLLDIDTLLTPYIASPGPATSRSRVNQSPRSRSRDEAKRTNKPTTGDIKVEEFKKLFCNKGTRPDAIFRDLQYIAAFVPSKTLETTAQGKAFWNAAAAISSLKRGASNIMVETADSIIAHHSNNRGHGRSPSVAQQERDSAAFAIPSSSPSPEDIGERSMSDAASLLQITAREGYPVAQRELATLYLTHPELMEHIIAPLSRPCDVFKEELESKWRKNQDPSRCDPATMCVAHHWMSLSAKGGDLLAMEFLRQREEMERLP